MNLDQILLQEIKDIEVWLSREKEESVYKRDVKKRIELINWVLDNWVLENRKNPNEEICSLIESRMSETIREIKKLDSIFESDMLDSELRILDWIFYHGCSNELKECKKITLHLIVLVCFGLFFTNFEPQFIFLEPQSLGSR